MVNNFHSFSSEKALKSLASSLNGISNKDSKLRLKKYGYNEIVDKKKFSSLLILLKQFKSFFVLILIFAAVLSYFIKPFTWKYHSIFGTA